MSAEKQFSNVRVSRAFLDEPQIPHFVQDDNFVKYYGIGITEVVP